LLNLLRRSRLLLWWIYLIGWTTALVAPIRDQTAWVVTAINIDLKFLVAKTVHVVGYALFAALTGWLLVPLRARWLMMFLLMSHGTLTELIQEHVEGRNGNLHDVALDQLGIALGVLFTWRWWRDPG